ncbi:polymer-forming cytoskeletal protein [Risungbinella massiliensis]|uniref:polymer-forming cytoskeletal protein n=1 Tax=Risungbinella massiliensis TaxID=1329796 RepID=UPI0005CBD0A1|nr:polymer-forming cytoskeletal protein [Risungbinella massiliensis]
MKRFFFFLGKAILASILLAILLLGFSFLDNGNLSQGIRSAIGWDLPRNMVQIPADFDTDTENETNEWNSPNEDLSFQEQTIHHNITGQSVIIQQRSQIIGNVIGTDSVLLSDSSVVGTIQAPSVQIGEGMPLDKMRRETYVKGNVLGSNIVLKGYSVVLGNIGESNSSLDIRGRVTGNLIGQQIVLRSGAQIQGDVITTQPEVVMEEGAIVRGQVKSPSGQPVHVVHIPQSIEDPHNQLIHRKKNDSIEYSMPLESDHFHERGHRYDDEYLGEDDYHPKHVIYKFHGRDGWNGSFFLWLPILLGLIAIVVFAQILGKNELEKSLTHLQNQPKRSLWIGFLTGLIAVPAIFLLGITIIGIPVAIALSLLLLGALWFGFTIVSEEVGTYLAGRWEWLGKQNSFLHNVFGILLIASLIWIPILGWLLMIALLFTGFGAVIIEWRPRLQNQWKQWREKRKKQKTKTEQQGTKEPNEIPNQEDASVEITPEEEEKKDQ